MNIPIKFGFKSPTGFTEESIMDNDGLKVLFTVAFEIWHENIAI